MNTTNSFTFGDTPEMADRLLGLVLAGTKTATTSSCSDPAATHGEVGKRWTVLDGQGRARAVIETTELTVCRFDEVTEAHARFEGEGDMSLEYWRKVHKDFFTKEGTYAPDMKVMCERFRLVKIL